MKNINFKLGFVAIAVTVSPLGTFATTAGNPAVVNLLPPPAGVTCTGVVLDNTGEDHYWCQRTCRRHKTWNRHRH